MGVPFEKRSTDFSFHTGGTLACSPHFHPHIEFFYLEKGKMVCRVDTEHYVVEAGDLLIAFPHQVHVFEDAEGETTPECHQLGIVHPNLVPELSRVFLDWIPACALIKHLDQSPEVLELLYRVIDLAYRTDPWCEVQFRGYLQVFFAKLLERLELVHPHNEESRALREVVNFCSEHYNTDISLDRLEEELHLSRYYISHLFSHRLNIRFNDYVNSLRVTQACRLLRKTDLSITEICAQVGFGTLRTFNRSFLKQRGLTPGEYRAGFAPKTNTKGERGTRASAEKQSNE